MHSATATTLVSMTSRSSSPTSSWMGRAVPETPALLKAPSSRPLTSSATATVPSMSDSSVTSHRLGTTVGPSLAVSSSRRSSRRAAAITVAPSSTNRSTAPAPMPLEAPKTTMVLPSSRSLVAVTGVG